MVEPILEVRRLKKYFKGPGGFLERRVPLVRALDGVSFRVFPGETFGFVGESGCGKSTLGKTVLGIYRATGGEVLFKGRNITGLSKREAIRVRKEIQYVYQDPGSSLDPHWKIKRILAEPLHIHTDLDRKAIDERIREMLGAVGLGEEHLTLYPHEFSGGQQRRLGLARILCLNPSLVILDEPTSGLDVSVQATILKLFLDLKSRFDLTYIFISHNLSVVRMMCQRLAVMYAGKIMEMGETPAIFENPVHPYTRFLLSAIPIIGKKAGSGEEISVSGEPPNPEDFPPGCRFHPRCPHATDLCRKDAPELRRLEENRWIACHRDL
ncbi:MAG: ATP-binding cassette domain-containing protein [Deltaproteobacteria bacterium]|nr:ATP-binding cassette domain-containing protein [Deltaproteobacteria bacterium]